MTGRLQSSCIEIVPSAVYNVFITDVLKVDVAGRNFKKNIPTDTVTVPNIELQPQ